MGAQSQAGLHLEAWDAVTTSQAPGEGGWGGDSVAVSHCVLSGPEDLHDLSTFVCLNPVTESS